MNPILEKEIIAGLEIFRDFPKEGISFKDIGGIFRNPELLGRIVKEGANQLKEFNPQIVYGIESRGFLLGVPIALELRIPFAMVRKKGKLPGNTMTKSYSLEYGNSEIEIQTPGVIKFQNAVLIDDVLATGGTANAAAQLLQDAGIHLCAIFFLLELQELNGRNVLSDGNYPIISLAKT